jgi:hypothetical protein
MDNSSLESSEKEEIKFTPDYKAGEPIFLHVFKELSNDNNGLVTINYKKGWYQPGNSMLERPF